MALLRSGTVSFFLVRLNRQLRNIYSPTSFEKHTSAEHSGYKYLQGRAAIIVCLTVTSVLGQSFVPEVGVRGRRMNKDARTERRSP